MAVCFVWFKLTTLWNWVPQRLTVNAPSLLFTTEVNGTSMGTLFNVLDELEHCILVIKTFDNEVSRSCRLRVK